MPFISMGYPESEFWKLNPKTIQVYYKAFDMRMKREYQLAWYNGLCVKSAIESSVFACGLVDKKTINKLPKYMSMPFEDEMRQKHKDKEQPMTEKRKEAEIQRFEAYMNTWMRTNNRK